jgi:hypothetical protein
MKGGSHMMDSALSKQMGRITFLLSSLVVAVACGASLQLLLNHAGNRRVTYVVAAGLIFLGVFWIRSVEHRLMDAGLPRWYFWPYFLFVFSVCATAHVAGLLDNPHTLMLFFALQIPTVFLQSKPALTNREEARSYSAYNQPVGHFLFLLRMLLLATFWVALFQLQTTAGRGLALWEMRLGLLIVALVWIYNVEGRLMDAGQPHSLSFPYCLLVSALCFLPAYFKITDHASLLAPALFVVLQIPTFFFCRKASPAVEPLSSSSIQPEASGLPALQPSETTGQIDPVGGFEFATRILILAGLLWVLHLLRGDTGYGRMAWALDAALDAASVFVCALWAISVKGRLKKLGRMRSYLDFCTLVFIVCLLVMAFAGAGFSQALVLFAVLQIPVMLMRRESILARLFLADAN